MSHEPIDSPLNPVVKSLRALADLKARRTRRLFIVEGVRAIEEGLRAGFAPTICLYNEKLLERTERGAKLAHALQRAANLSLYTASERALQAAADTLNPQGIVAAFPFLKWTTGANGAQPFLALVCDEIRDPGNMGTLLRTAEAAGVHAVWTTPGCVDIYNPKVVRAAMGTHFRLPIFAERPWLEIRSTMPDRGVAPSRLFCTEKDAKLAYDRVDWTQSSAIVISNEAHGLSAEASESCREGENISIPMLAETESLNAAIAGAIIMFEAARQRRQSKEGE